MDTARLEMILGMGVLTLAIVLACIGYRINCIHQDLQEMNHHSQTLVQP
jgi:hypothetical protein